MWKEEVVIWSTDLLGEESHSDTDLKKTMHTNEIITDVVGGLSGKRKSQAPADTLPSSETTANAFQVYGN